MTKRPWNGPWVFDRFYGEVFVESETDGRTSVAMVLLDRKGDEAGHLIAAAPLLFEALDNINRVFDGYGKERLPEYVRREFAQVRAALAKAGGAS